MQNSSRERVLKALLYQKPDKVPCDYLATLEVDQKLRDYFGFPTINREIEVEEGVARWSIERGKSVKGILDKLGVDIRQVNPSYIAPYIEKYPDGSWKDIWGVIYQKVPNEFGEYVESISRPFAAMKTLDDVKNYPWPSPDWYDYSTVYQQCLEYEGYAIKAGGPGVIDLINGVSNARGMEQVLIDIGTKDPVGMAIFDKRFEFYYEFARRTLKSGKGKIDIFWIGDDMGSQQGLLISPHTWRDIFKPYMKKMIDLIHSFGAKAMMHSCGSTHLIWDDLVELGLDIYQTVQEQAMGMDPEELKKKYGDKMCLHGAIDSQGFLQNATPDEVKKVVRERIEVLNDKGGYICASCHNLQPDIPVENIITMYEAINESREKDN